MARTGYIIEVYEDINPSSPTYNTTREDRTRNESECPSTGTANWIEDSRYCEQLESGAFTGYQIIVERDVEELSPTYNQTRERKVLNTSDCEADTSDPGWINIGEPYCRQKVYLPSGKMGNDGYRVQEQMDANEYSPTYEQIRNIETYSPSTCPVPNTAPNETVISQYCEIIGGEKTGRMITKYIDSNEYSPTYTGITPMERYNYDYDNCPIPLVFSFSVTPTNTVVNSTGSLLIINVNSRANGDFWNWNCQMVGNPDWISIGIKEESKVEVEVFENTPHVSRTAQITFSQVYPSTETITVTITQSP